MDFDLIWVGDSSQFHSNHTHTEGRKCINTCSYWMETVKKYRHEEYLEKLN